MTDVPPPRARTFDVTEIANTDPLGSTPRVPHLFPPSPFPLAPRSLSLDDKYLSLLSLPSGSFEALLQGRRHDDVEQDPGPQDARRSGPRPTASPVQPIRSPVTRTKAQELHSALHRRSSEPQRSSQIGGGEAGRRGGRLLVNEDGEPTLDPFFDNERQNAAFERLANRYRREGLGEIANWDESCWPRGPEATTTRRSERELWHERGKRLVESINYGPGSESRLSYGT